MIGTAQHISDPESLESRSSHSAKQTDQEYHHAITEDNATREHDASRAILTDLHNDNTQSTEDIHVAQLKQSPQKMLHGAGSVQAEATTKSDAGQKREAVAIVGDREDSGDEAVPTVYKLKDIPRIEVVDRWHMYAYEDGETYPEALCLRNDGRMLAMHADQFNAWRESDKHRGRLSDLAAGRAVQVDHDVWIHQRRADAIDKEDEEEAAIDDDAPNTGVKQRTSPQHNVDLAQSQESSVEVKAQLSSISNAQEIFGHPKYHADKDLSKCFQADQTTDTSRNCHGAKQAAGLPKSSAEPSLSPEAQSAAKDARALSQKNNRSSAKVSGPPGAAGEKKIQIYPPCYCNSCSELLWRPGGFTEVLDYQLVANDVQKWVEQIQETSRTIRTLLKAYMKPARRRWEKATVGQRRHAVNKVYSGIPTYATLAETIGDYWPRQKAKKTIKKSKKCQCSGCKTPKMNSVALPWASDFLMAALNLDELAEDPNELFNHLHARSNEHPAAFFLADLIKVEGAAQITAEASRPYIFGTFNITPSNYGRWQHWSDDEIHSFETVVAPCSMYVFKSQARVLDVLAVVLGNLVAELSPSMAMAGGVVELSPLFSQSTLLLPTMFNLHSIFANTLPPTVDLQIAVDLAYGGFLKVLEELTNLRTDNAAFVDRIKSCEDFSKAAEVDHGVRDDVVAFHVLTKPFERCLIWLHLRLLLSRLIESRERPADDRMHYVKTFKALLCFIEHRYMQIKSELEALLENLTRPARIVPITFLANHSRSIKLLGWLGVYFLNHPHHQSRPLKMAFMQKCFQVQAEDTLAINDVVREAIEETTFLAKLSENLFLCEPMISLQNPEVIIEPDAMWFKVVRALRPDLCMAHMKMRGSGINNILDTVTMYSLPSGERDSRWYEKHDSARRYLMQTWTSFGHNTLEYYKRQGFPVAWLEIVQKLLIVTQPEKESAVTTPRPKLRNDTESQVSQESFTDTPIPHHFGPDTPTARKLTKKKRDELNPPAEDDSGSSDDELYVRGPASSVPLMPDPQTIRIQIKRRYLPIVDSLFSKAQEQVSSVRWDRFERFMADAGLKVENGEGVAVVFSGRNVIDGRNTSLVLHRPHPDPTLYAVHMRNDTRKIVDCFGWAHEMFVARN